MNHRELARSLLRQLRRERQHRPLPVKFTLDYVPELEKKIETLKKKIESQDRDASGLRLIIANHQKTIEKYKQDLGRDEKIKENEQLKRKLASMDRVQSDLAETNRQLSSEAAEARGKVQGLVNQLTDAEYRAGQIDYWKKQAIEFQEYKRAEIQRDEAAKVQFEMNLWKERAIANGWVDPESLPDYQKLMAKKREEAKKEHPDWTDAQLDQFIDTVGRIIET